MSARRAIWEVARRELVERSRSRVLRGSLVILLILSVGGAIAAARIGGGKPHDHVGLVGARSVALEPAIRAQAKAAGRGVALERFAGPAAARTAVRSGHVDVVVIDGSRLLVKRSRTTPAARVVRDAVAAQAMFERLRGSGLSSAQALSALTPPAVRVDALEPSSRSADRNKGMVYVGTLVLFGVLVGFGQAVASSVTEEKTSRVVELLLTTLSPRRLLAGKILGVGTLGLGLLIVPGAAALAAGRLAGGEGLPSAAPETIALVLLWFVLGYALYSVAFATVGALVSRHEDLDAAVLPVSFVLIGSWIVAMVALQEPNSTLAKVAAFVPPFAPMVVPTRVVLGDMGALELVAAVAVDVLATVGLVLLAARIYERTILHTGARLKLKRVLVDAGGTERSRVLDLGLRVLAIAMLVAGAAIGFGEPLSIALIVLALLALAVRQRLPQRPAHR